jgi:hypothetical protein
MENNKNPQGRKWQITINNPIEHDFTHERLKSELDKFKSAIYWCMSDEQGIEEQTHHTHIFLMCSSPIRFSTLKIYFTTAHLERANGTAQENRDYIAKSGKWADSEKAETLVEGTFEEWGEMPVERQGSFSIESVILERIQNGSSNAEILLEFPDCLRMIHQIEFVRQTLITEENRNKWRTLETVYIFGSTGVGKTRSVMESHGYANVYAVNDYKHPFDGYKGESVLLFDEFHSGIRIQDMNNYLDGYPITLPARYSNKQACYERVYIISNLDLLYQYKHEQTHQPEVWAAFLRRIHKVIYFMPDGTRREYTTADYIASTDAWVEILTEMPMPFESTQRVTV